MKNLEEVRLDAYENEDKEEFIRLTERDVFSLFVYNKNILFNGESTWIDANNYKVRPEYRNGEIFAPISVFRRLGCTVDGYTISYREASVELIPSSKEYRVRNSYLEFSTAPQLRFGHLYACVKDVAKALGFDTIILYDNRLIIVGAHNAISAIKAAAKNNPAIQYAGGSVVIGEYDATVFTSSDYKIAKDKWRSSLVLTPEQIDLSDKEIVKKIAVINERSRELWCSLNKNADRVILWGDEPPSESCHLRFQYEKLYTLTLGYATYGGELYRNPELKTDILNALRWMYENMYGEAELEDRGWRSIHTFNWWDWYVGGIEPLTNTMLLMEEYLTMEEKKKYLKLLEFVLDHWRVTNSQDNCSGRMSVGTKCALLLEDPIRLARSANDYHVMLEVVLAGPGTHTDYCNYQHGFPYNMMYGMSNINRVLKVGANLAGTPLEFSSPRYYNQFILFKYMYEAAMYRGRGFMCFWGRASSGSERSAGMGVITGILPMIGGYGAEEDEYIRKFVKYSLSSPEQINEAKGCSLGVYATLKSILDDDSIPTDNNYECAHAWFSADRAVLHRNDYAFCVSMPSYRHPNYECINNANKTGWYMNDGTLYLYTKTDPFEFDGVNFVLNNRLAHRMPGTTVDVRERKAVSIASGYRPSNDRVGCMQFDNKIVIAGMDYTAYSRDEDEPMEDKGYGGGKPAFQNDLVARKAYFMLDKECVCLGAGITSTMNSDINTVVEHRRLVKLNGTPDGADVVSLCGEKAPSSPFDITLDSPTFVMVEDFAGFVFLDKQKVSVSKYKYDLDGTQLDIYLSKIPEYAKGSRPFVEVMINHGKNPKNASYAYAVLPYADEDKLECYSKAPEVEILSNTPECQAVRKNSLCFTGIIFYEAGEFGGIKVDAPCLISYFDNGKEFNISACEPTNKVDCINIYIDRSLSLVDADSRYSVICGANTVISIDTSLSAGEAYTASFKYN